MKKLLTLILLATIFVSCSKDEDDNTVYLDNKIIEGKWTYSKNVSSRTYFVFENGELKYEDWNYSGTEIDSETNYGKYRLSKDVIYVQSKIGEWKAWNYYKLEKNLLGGTDLSIEISQKWQKYTKIEELDRKLIEGKWRYYMSNGFIYRIYRNGRLINIKWSSGEGIEEDLGTYKLMSDRIIYEDLKEEYFYKLEGDTLSILDNRYIGGYYTPYIKVK